MSDYLIRRLKGYLPVWLTIFTLVLHSQTITGQQAAYPKEKTEELKKFSEELKATAIREKRIALNFALRNNLPVREELPDGRVIELQYLDEKGHPVYYVTHNAGAALTVGTNQLHPGGKLGTSVTGSGMTVGVWDAGGIFGGHNELTGRIALRDNAAAANDHATHVGGTIAAAGNQANVKGMAFQASVDSYDWTNDIAELTEAASRGLLVSNHSYGILLGWDYSDGKWKWNGTGTYNVDHRFGFYTNKESRTLDQLAYAAPYLLMVRSAGNDRNDFGDGSKPADGPYDCIGPEAIAKNVLAVGSVAKIPGGYRNPEDVVMTAYSSWGPADDGRIKPDLVAPGNQIFSTLGNGNYGTLSGTSMASPVVTGSLLLLQQLHQQLNGSYMLASTLKALAIHTASAAGKSRGPDYEFGWGLLNTEEAAKIILYKDNFNNHINELTLSQGQVYEYEFYADGTKDILATICWTDPPGTPPSTGVNPTDIMLVNDLDILITDDTGKEYFPFVMNQTAATTGVNSRDNVEKIIIESPVARKYKLRVSHKGTLLNGSQAFSLLLTTSALPFDEDPVLFWIGNSGSWHNPANWSLSSGGPAANIVPTDRHHVIFDEKSFKENGDKITIGSPAGCKSLSYMSSKLATFEVLTNNIEVSKFFFVSTQNGFVQQGGFIRVKNPDTKVSSVSDKYLNLEVDASGGTVEILSNANIDKLVVKSGQLRLKGNRYAIKSFTTQGSGTKILELGRAILSNEGEFDFSDTSLTIIPGQSEVVCKQEAGKQALIKGGELTLKTLRVVSGSLKIDASLSASTLYNSGEIVLSNNSSVSRIDVEAGGSLVIGGGKTLRTELINLFSTADKKIILGSTGPAPANLVYNLHTKACFDNLLINNVTASGIATVVAGANSVLTGATTGWVTLSCHKALFADFEYQFPCQNGHTVFKDKSTGDIEEWAWTFGDPTMPLAVSNEQNASCSFPAQGKYPVSLLIKSKGNEKLFTKTIDIGPNSFSGNTIKVEGDVYTSVQIAVLYQWYIDGIPLTNATQRTFNAAGWEGKLTVMVMDMNCSSMSPPVLLVGAKSLTVAQNQLHIYPNPAFGQVTFSLNCSDRGGVHYSIFNSLGVKVKQGIVNKPEQHLKIVENTDGLMAGMYLIKLDSDSQTIASKFLVR